MKKLILAACAAAALVVPAAPAAASDIPPPVGTKSCPAPYVGGYIVWVNTGPTGYHEEWFCIPGTPGAATDTEGPIVQLRECPDGYVGRSVWVGDRGLLWNCYRLP